MTLIERLTMQLTEEQRERFFELIDENPDVEIMHLYRRLLREPINLQEE